MSLDFDRAKEEQEKRRELWRQQQKDRRQEIKPKPLEKFARKEYQRRLKPQTPVQALRRATEEIGEGRKGTEEEGYRKTARILARLRAQRLQELREKRSRGQKKGGEAEEGVGQVKEEIEEAKNAAERLRTIYRIINGTTAVTLVGLIITFSVMNAQLLFGNLLKLKIIPKLSFPEILIVLFINFIIFIALVVLLLLICTIIAIITENPIVQVFI